MGFGNFLKKAINPLTPFKAVAGVGKNLARGNVGGALTGAATMGMAGGGGRSGQNVQQARPGFERLSQQPGPFGAIAKQWLAKNPAQDAMAQGAGQMTGGPGLGPKQMSPQLAQMGMEQWGGLGPSGPPQPGPGPSALQMGIQQAIGGNPQEADPYEAWKAGGRQGNRPAGY